MSRKHKQLLTPVTAAGGWCRFSLASLILPVVLQSGMIRKLLIMAMLILAGSVVAVEPWQHDVRPVFSEPLDFILLPWTDPVEPQSIGECWRRDQGVPFLGSGHQFWCFLLPRSMNAMSAREEIRHAVRDAGLMLRGDGRVPAFVHFADPTEVRAHQEFSIVHGGSLNVWYFEHPEGAFISFAFKPGGGPLQGAMPEGPLDLESERIRNIGQPDAP